MSGQIRSANPAKVIAKHQEQELKVARFRLFSIPSPRLFASLFESPIDPLAVISGTISDAADSSGGRDIEEEGVHAVWAELCNSATLSWIWPNAMQSLALARARRR